MIPGKRRSQACARKLRSSLTTVACLSVLLPACTRGNSSENYAEENAKSQQQDLVQEEQVQSEGKVQVEEDAVVPTATSDENGLISVTRPNSTVRPEQREFSDDLMAQLKLEAGYQINVFAQDLVNPGIIVVSENGNVYVSEREAGRVRLLQDTNGDGRADRSEIVASGLGEKLQGVHGLAIHQGQLYMVTETEVHVASIQEDGKLGEPTLIRDDIPSGGQHPNRTIAVGPDGKLYLSVGSTCNACVEPNEQHAAMLRLDLEGSETSIFASGLRNTIGFDWHPETGQLWGFDHNSDGRGQDEPPEELNHIQEGKDYGWPFCFGDQLVDYQLSVDPEEGSREEYCRGTEPPVLTYQGHAAPMQFIFYTADHFPAAEDKGMYAFATMRGSWNRNPPVGYEVVRVKFDESGQPVSAESFVSGWLLEQGRAHFGRLTGLAQAADGSLLISDDHNGIIYRVSFSGH